MSDDGARELPAKEGNLFKQVVKAYETKQYKKGLKAADAVLKKFPNHGETLSMKGLIVSNTGEDKKTKTEAHDLVKLGLKNDVKSHVCWHVYGLLHRQDHNYREAIKCYRMALRIDPGNLQILRDLSFLQVQVRDLVDFAETRRQILLTRPGSRINWICFAIANHMGKKYDMALRVMDQYEATMLKGNMKKEGIKDGDAVTAQYEDSEMYMFKAMIYEEAGRPEDALAVLKNQAGKIVDAVGSLEQKARLYSGLASQAAVVAGDPDPDRSKTFSKVSSTMSDAATSTYRELLATNPDNHRYHEALQAVMGVTVAAPPTGAQLTGLKQLYTELQAANPRSDTCKRFPLDYLSGAEFASAVRDFVVKPLRKGVPSLFRNLKGLYADPAKGAEMGVAFAEIVESLATSKKFPGVAEAEANPEECRVYALTLLSHHKDKMGDTDGALATIDAALAIEPPVIECYLAKASFLKHAGALGAAAAVAEHARSLDLADRYLNSICTKRLLQAGDVEMAEKTVALFTRDGDQASNMFDMQCVWFENEAGRCHARAGRRGRALKYFAAVRKHYDDMEEDQFDFHQYCLRKMTLRSYVHMLRVEDTLFSRKPYREAAKSAVEVYLDLHDHPLAEAAAAEEARLAQMTGEDRKKYRKKQRQASERKEKEEGEKKKADDAAAKEAAEAAAKDKDKDGKKKKPPAAKKEDPDPVGDALLKTSDPLGEAARMLEPLLRHATEFEQTHLLAFDVYFRKGRLLLALRAVNAAIRLAPLSFPARRNVVHLAVEVAALPADTRAPVRAVLEEGVRKLMDGTSVEGYAGTLAESATREGPLAAAVAAEAVGLACGAGRGAAAAAAAAGSAAMESSTVAECMEALAVLARMERAAGADTATSTALRTRCAIAHPYCDAFGGAKAGATAGK